MLPEWCGLQLQTGDPPKEYWSQLDFKRNLAISFLLGMGAAAGAYALAWGLFTTHQELGLDSRNAFALAAWTGPLIFFASLIYLAVRSAGRR